MIFLSSDPQENLEISKNNALILCYHGVTDCPSYGIENYSGKHLSNTEFEHQIKFIHQNMHPISLLELQMRIATGQITPGLVAITFDDGYSNVANVAIPILNKYKIPATLFISPGFISKRTHYWVDLLEHWVNVTTHTNININISKIISANYSLVNSEARIETLSRLKNILKSVSQPTRKKILAFIKKELNVFDDGDSVVNYSIMTWKELTELVGNPLISIGAHTVHHEILSLLSNNLAQKEVSKSRFILESKLGVPIRHFAYPNGRNIDYNVDTIRFLKEAGFECSVTAEPGFSSANDDLFTLRRVPVGFMGQKFPFVFDGNS